MAWTLTTSGAAIAKAGLNANSNVIVSGGLMDKWSDDAEGYIIGITRRDWVDSYATVDAGTKALLSDVCSSIIAKNIISYDMSGYSTRSEAETMLDVNDDAVKSGISALKDFKSNTIKGV